MRGDAFTIIRNQLDATVSRNDDHPAKPLRAFAPSRDPRLKRSREGAKGADLWPRWFLGREGWGQASFLPKW